MKFVAKKTFFMIIVIISIGRTFPISLIGVRADVFAESRLFIDFGASETENIYGLNDWGIPIVSSHSAYTSVNGHTGVRLVSGTSQWDGYQGVKGTTSFSFQEGDLIRVTWYNSSSTTEKLKNLPLISFEDPDQPVDQTGEPQWYVMTYGTKKVAPREQFETYFVSKSYEGKGVPVSTGEHTLVNVNFNNIDQDIICEKIEYIPAEQARPTQPNNLIAKQNSNHPDSKVDLTWHRSTGVLDIEYYRIYRNGIWIYKTEQTQFTVPLLEYSTEYTFTITAVDLAGNESLHSSGVTMKTAEFQGRNDLINPQKDITYLGAFRLPSVSGWGYRCGGISYYPAGDPNNIDGDDYPGSLYAFGHIWYQKAAEISIPEPCISKNYAELPQAQMLSDFHKIRPENYPGSFNPMEPDLTYLPTKNKFYTVFGDHYNVDYQKKLTHGAFEPDFSQVSGLWYIGAKDDLYNPEYSSFYRFIFDSPENWAHTYVDGKMLIAGGVRTSGLRGPSLLAVKAWNDDDSNPEPGAELAYTKLLYYGPHHENDNKELDGWVRNDNWNGGSWLTTDRKTAVVIIGAKAHGEYYYGIKDGIGYNTALTMVPKHPQYGTKGSQSRSYEQMMLFYDPEDFAKVAQGQMEPWKPQPYAILKIDEYMLRPNNDNPASGKSVAQMTFDRERGLIYIVERGAYQVMDEVIHVFQLSGNSPDNGDILISKE